MSSERKEGGDGAKLGRIVWAHTAEARPTLRFYLFVSWDVPPTGAKTENDDLPRPPPVLTALHGGGRHVAT